MYSTIASSHLGLSILFIGKTISTADSKDVSFYVTLIFSILLLLSSGLLFFVSGNAYRKKNSHFKKEQSIIEGDKDI